MECIKIKAWDDESFGTDLVDWKRKQWGERDDFFSDDSPSRTETES